MIVSSVLFWFFIVGCGAIDPNVGIDEALGIVANNVGNKISVKDIRIQRKDVGWLYFPVDLNLKGNTLEDATSITRIGDAVFGKENGQDRLEVQLSLTTLKVNYGSFDLKLPLLHASGSAELELRDNSVGLTVYFKADCNQSNVFIWPPHGKGYATIRSSWWFSKPAQWIFNFFDHYISGDVMNSDLLLEPLNNALATPLTSAIKEAFCSKP